MSAHFLQHPKSHLWLVIYVIIHGFNMVLHQSCAHTLFCTHIAFPPHNLKFQKPPIQATISQTMSLCCTIITTVLKGAIYILYAFVKIYLILHISVISGNLILVFHLVISTFICYSYTVPHIHYQNSVKHLDVTPSNIDVCQCIAENVL